MVTLGGLIFVLVEKERLTIEGVCVACELGDLLRVARAEDRVDDNRRVFLLEFD